MDILGKPTIVDRSVVFVVSVLFGCLFYAGKVSVFVLHVTTCLLFLLLVWNVKGPATALAELAREKVSAAAILLTLFAGFASLSAIWAVAPAEAVSAGISLFASIVACQVLLAIYARLPVRTLVLLGGWQIICFAFGIVFLWYELKHGYLISMWFANYWLGTKFDFGSMAVIDGGKIVYIQHHAANWGVATANIFLWPLVLLASLVLDGLVKKAAIAALVVLVAVMTYASDHQTSQIAFPIAAIMVLLGHYFRHIAQNLLIAGCAAVFVLIVPASQLLFQNSGLDRAGWVHPSLQARVIIWGVTADNVRNAPFLGIGAKSTRQWGERHSLPVAADEGRSYPLSTDAHAHNNYLQIWFELGAIGAALLAAGAISLLHGISKLHREVAPYAIGMATVVLLVCFAGWSVWNSWLSATFALGIVCLRQANRVCCTDLTDEQRGSFARIWLPEKLTPRLSRAAGGDTAS